MVDGPTPSPFNNREVNLMKADELRTKAHQMVAHAIHELTIPEATPSIPTVLAYLHLADGYLDLAEAYDTLAEMERGMRPLVVVPDE